MTYSHIVTLYSSLNPGYGLDINADGTRIAYESTDASSRSPEIWLYDTIAVTYTRITTNSDNDRGSSKPNLNANGTKVVFNSDSDFKGQGIANGQHEIWLYDTATKVLTRVTTVSDTTRDSFHPAISADGTKIAFSSNADFLGQGISEDQFEIWLYDVSTLTLTRVTTTSSIYRGSFFPDLNVDGTKLVFQSTSDFFGQGIPEKQDEIWLYDTVTKVYTRVTTAIGDSRTSEHPKISADGTKIVFYSDSDFFSEGIDDDQFEIWLYDTTVQTLTQITNASDSYCITFLPLILKQ